MGIEFIDKYFSVHGVCFLISIVSLFSRYEFDSYGMLLLMTCIVINLSRIYITYYKLHGKLIKLNIQQFLPHFVLLVLVLIMWNKLTVRQIVVSYFVSNVIALIILGWICPILLPFKLIDRSHLFCYVGVLLYYSII